MVHEHEAAGDIYLGDTKSVPPKEYPSGPTGGHGSNLRLFPSSAIGLGTGVSFIPVDIIEHDSYYLVKADLIGVRKEDIDVVRKDGILTITAYSRRRPPLNGGRIIRQELRHGRYVRSLRLGSQVDDKKLRVLYKDGMLELNLPKADSVVPKKIPVERA